MSDQMSDVRSDDQMSDLCLALDRNTTKPFTALKSNFQCK